MHLWADAYRSARPAVFSVHTETGMNGKQSKTPSEGYPIKVKTEATQSLASEHQGGSAGLPDTGSHAVSFHGLIF